MAKTNYSFEKRRKELERKNKKAEKKKRKLETGGASSDETTDAEPTADSPTETPVE